MIPPAGNGTEMDTDRGIPVADLLPDASFRHRLRGIRGDPGAFFRSWDSTGRILAERRHWLGHSPALHAVQLPEARSYLAEVVEMSRGWLGPAAGAGDIIDADPAGGSLAGTGEATAGALQQLGVHLEPDILLLAGGDRLRMIAGCVCFPSAWAPESRLGLPLEQIHEVVPGLNEQIGDSIRHLLDRLPPGTGWQRANWGLSASAERNQHPSRGLPRLRAPLASDGVWLRIEQQILLRLARSHGILFGIRVESWPLRCVVAQPGWARGLRRALESMPDALLEYKGLLAVRADLLDLLAPTTGGG